MRGVRRWIRSPVLLLVLASFVAGTLYVCARVQPTYDWMYGWTPRVFEYVPRGFVPAPPNGTITSYLLPISTCGDECSPGIVAEQLTGAVLVRAPVLLIWHIVACLFVLTLYRVYGFPPLLGKEPGSVGVRQVRTHVLVASAWLSVGWAALAALMSLFWWSVYMARPEGVNLPLAQGTFGRGGIVLGAVLAHLLTIAYVTKRSVLAGLNEDVSGFIRCGNCGYALATGSTSPCPECGRSRVDGDRPIFALGRRMADVSRSRWRIPWRVGVIVVIVALFCAPLTLALLGSLFPARFLQDTSDWWFSLF